MSIPSASINSNFTGLHPRAPVKIPNNAPTRYAIVVDAGSSGSRAQLFSWKDPAVLQSSLSFTNSTILNSAPQITQDSKYNKKIIPGISFYAGKTKLIWKKHLSILLKHVEKGVPASERKNTPVFFLATAGMRLLPEKDQREILQTVCSLLKEKTDFYVPECDTHVSIIDGQTEALYGWLSLNYLLGSFTQKSTLSPPPPTSIDASISSEYRKSFGFMDMGGASMQIAFCPNATETEKHINDLYHVQLRNINGDNQEWQVFVSSWLGFGANEARRRFAQHLLQVEDYKVLSSQKRLPKDPCFPIGLTHEMSIDANTTLTFEGTGNFSTCLNTMQPLLRKDQPCAEDPCLFNGVHAPAIDFEKNKFVGVSEYWYTANSIFKLGGNYDFTRFSRHVDQYCSLPWDELKLETKNGGRFEGIPEEKLKSACFKATWVINVLHSGFGIPIDEKGTLIQLNKRSDELELVEKSVEMSVFKRELNNFVSPFQSADAIGDIELTWMLGRALLYSSSQIPSSSSSNSDVGFLPADLSNNQHYVLGGELNGAQIPALASQSSGSMSLPNASVPSSFSVSHFFGSILILGVLGYMILYILGLFKGVRCMPAWSSVKLRLYSIPRILNVIVLNLRRKAGLGNEKSVGYQRILEEGISNSISAGAGSGRNSFVMESGRMSPSLSVLNGDSLNNGKSSLYTSPIISGAAALSKIPSMANINFASGTNNGTSLPLNRVSSTANFSSSSAQYEKANNIDLQNNSSLSPPSIYNNALHLAAGKSTSMIDLSQFHNTSIRPPSRPSSRMGNFASKGSSLLNNGNNNL